IVVNRDCSRPHAIPVVRLERFAIASLCPTRNLKATEFLPIHAVTTPEPRQRSELYAIPVHGATQDFGPTPSATPALFPISGRQAAQLHAGKIPAPISAD